VGEGRMMNGWKVHESPVPGKSNKFVVTEDQIWFLAFEDKANALSFAEILPELLKDLDGVDGDKFDDGGIFGIRRKRNARIVRP
jgi:hypothetical protein